MIPSGKYLSFSLAGEAYAVPIGDVKEIIGIAPITPLMEVPEYVRGVIDLRGHAIPVVDMRRKFGIDTRDYDRETCIIILRNGERDAGAIVDTVEDVVEFKEEDIEEIGDLGLSHLHAQIKNGNLRGIGRIADKVLILVDLSRILDPEINAEATAS